MKIKDEIAKVSDLVWELYNNKSGYGDLELENEIKKVAILLDYLYKGYSYEKALKEYEETENN